MNKILKHKYNKRLSNLVRFDRNNFLRKSFSSKNKKFLYLSAIKYNKILRNYFVKKEHNKFFKASAAITKAANKKDNVAQPVLHTPLLQTLQKKKYKLGSYLFNIILKLPRKYIQNFLGKEILRRYYTMPLKISMTKFALNKILRSYYTNLSYKAISNLSKHKSLSKLTTTNISYKQPLFSSSRLLRNQSIPVEKKELSKKFVEGLEERLDSTLLRVLNFKSLYTIKRSNYLSYGQRRLHSKYVVKSPLSFYTSGQVKQLISHGHISINNASGNKPVYSKNYKLSLSNEISELKISGFISNASSKNLSDHKNTLLLRKLKDKSYLDTATAVKLEKTTEDAFAPLPLDTKDSEDSANNLIALVRDLRIKRFTELFYMTYRNLHLLDRKFVSSVSSASQNVPENGLARTTKMQEGLTESLSDNAEANLYHIEKHIQPLFTFMGYNQSIYQLWPIISLLSTSAFEISSKSAGNGYAAVGLTGTAQGKNKSISTFVKKNIIQYGIGTASVNTSKEDKRKLQTLLRYQKNLSKLENVRSTITFGTTETAQGKTDSDTQETTASGNIKKSIPERIMRLSNATGFAGGTTNKLKNNSLASTLAQGNGSSNIFTTKASRCYASLLYGTRSCKFVKFQQNLKNSFHNKFANKLAFFTWELEFFHYILKCYRQ